MTTMLPRSRPVVPARLLASLMLVILAGLSTGCQGFTGGTVRDDIVAIHQFLPNPPWVRDDDGRASGLRPRVYFISAETGRGVFVPGPFAVDLVERVPTSDGYERILRHTWSFSHREALGFRITKSSAMGESYGLVLRWPDELELGGTEIQLLYRYQRGDGRVIERGGSRVRVPLPPRMRFERGPRSLPDRTREKTS